MWMQSRKVKRQAPTSAFAADFTVKLAAVSAATCSKAAPRKNQNLHPRSFQLALPCTFSSTCHFHDFLLLFHFFGLLI